MRAQLLHRPGPRLSPGELVRRLCGVQAQVLSAAGLALRARTTGLVAADVDRARLDERSIVRTWAMRGTLHLIAAEDVSWLVPLVASSSLPDARRRLARLGVNPDASAKAIRLIGRMLEIDGPLTRAEVAERLARRGIPTEGQGPYHLLRLAGLEGVACFGPDRGSEPTLVLLRDWVGSERAREGTASLGELARRYLAAHGPADPADLAAWSGLTLAGAREGWRQIESELAEVAVGNRGAWMLRSQAGRGTRRKVVRFLPSFDPYVLGYRSREFAVPRAHARRVHPGGGIVHPVVIADGRAVGTWDSRRRGPRVVVTITPFDRMDPSVERSLHAEARDVGRFLDARAELVVG